MHSTNSTSTSSVTTFAQGLEWGEQWFEWGEQLIVALDANEALQNGPVATALQSHNLHEVLLTKHGQNAPPTTDNGSAVIDGIWATPSINIKQGGYLAGGEALPRMNHHCLRIDVTFEMLYGHVLPPIACYAIHWLKLQDP